MENAEEVMQLLEEFSKVKPKEIPRELEDYLGYVAKTGDPVYQWSLVKNLFREKLLGVITDFYESTLTVELPPCPNVEPFNYERMKTSLLERFDTFSGAPFTIQRICELLINPRKEYNRADKYMRAIEKNILVVSTREPGTGKRPLECDNQSETVLNGIPDVKLSKSDGSLLHVPTDLPYLGAPPASNDVTVETSEPNSTINDRVGVGLDVDEDLIKLKSEDEHWQNEESHSLPQSIEQANNSSELKSADVPLQIEEKCSEEINCDSNSRLSNVDSINPSVSPENFEGESSSDIFIQNNETILPDSIDSSDSTQECSEVLPNSKLENDEVGSISDENEVSSSPADAAVDIPLVQDEVEEPTDSEAEATDISVAQDAETGEGSSLLEDEISSGDKIIQTDETKLLEISEVTATKSDEVDLECNEITGTVESPVSPTNSAPSQTEVSADQKTNLELVEECEESDSHPDSSNDICLENTATSSQSEKPEFSLTSEADSMSETNVNNSELPLMKSDCSPDAPDQTDEVLDQNVGQVSSPSITKSIEVDPLENNLEDPVPSSNSLEEPVVSGSPCLNSIKEDIDDGKLTDVQSTSESVEEMYDQERREESVIQSTPNSQPTPDSQDQITIEEISVDPSCEAEEEAMDVDDCSNQMMITEGENEGEPMDQCDQSQS